MNSLTLRIYGLLIENNQVLISDELCHGQYVTKFPGGGLEFGEGPIDCVKREFKEEMDVKVDVIKHFHTTDFFSYSAFNPKIQVVCIYYLVKPLENLKTTISQKKFDFTEIKEGAQAFRWLPIKTIHENDFTFPTDQQVSQLLKLAIK